MQALTIGETFPDAHKLPPGDSFGFYPSSEGLRLLGVLTGLRSEELGGWNDGPIELAVTPHPLGVVIAANIGGVWAESVLAPVEGESSADPEVVDMWRTWAEMPSGMGGDREPHPHRPGRRGCHRGHADDRNVEGVRPIHRAADACQL